MSSIYLARQPIVSSDETLQAYEVMYRDSDGVHTSVASSIVNELGVKEFLNDHKAFIKVDTQFLMSDSLMNISPDIFVLSLLEDIELNEGAIERVEKLREKGFCIAAYNRDLNEDNILEYANVIDTLTYFKINISTSIGESEKELLTFLKKQNIKVVATNITNIQEYKKAQELECDLYQGCWFAKSKIVENDAFDPSELKVLDLYKMLLSDVDVDAIASEFENYEVLNTELLKFINSENFDFTTEMLSVKQVLTVVGKKTLSSWLLLMIYSKSASKANSVSPLMLMVKNRTELMQNLLKTLKPDVNNNALAESYLIGAVSLLDAIFQAKLSDILEYMNISAVSKQALLNDAGALGKIYKLVRDIEAFDVAEIVTFTQRYKVQEEAIEKVIIQSIKDVNIFETSLNAG